MNINLAGQTIVVTRPAPHGLTWCEEIEVLHGQALHFPTLAFKSLVEQSSFQQALLALGEQDWLIFISPQAVYESIALIRRQWPTFPPTVKFAAVGKGTALALRQAGYIVNACPETNWNSEGLLALPPFQSVGGEKIAIVRGEGGRGLLEDQLRARGASVLPVIAYQRIQPIVSENECHRLQQQKISAIICTSGESVQNLKALLGETAWGWLQTIPLIVISERIKVLARDLGFQTIWVARNASLAAVMDTMKKHLK